MGKGAGKCRQYSGAAGRGRSANANLHLHIICTSGGLTEDGRWKEYPKGFVAYIEKGDVPAGGKGLAHYLAKYVVSPPVALKRIIKYDGKKVRYWYKDHATGRRQEEEVDALTFIGRMV